MYYCMIKKDRGHVRKIPDKIPLGGDTDCQKTMALLRLLDRNIHYKLEDITTILFLIFNA